MTPALALLFNHASAASAACARPKHKVFTQEAGAGGVSRAGWLELEQSNSTSFENESLKTLTSAFCHRCHRFLRKRSGSIWRQHLAATARAAAVGGNSQGNSRSLRHLCWCFHQGSGSAGSWEPPRARDWESPGAARSSRADGSGREQPAAAWRWAPLATCLGGRAYPGSAGNREPLGELPKPREGGQYIIADLLTYEPAFGLVSHFAEPCKRPTNPQPTFLARNI